MVFLVLLRVDGDKGSAVVACTGIQQDPLFPNKVVLTGVQALSWPFHGKFLGVEQWSVDKDVVINWMVGPLRSSHAITAEMLQGKGQDVPRPPKSNPMADLGDREALRRAVEDLERKQAPEAPSDAKPAEDPPPKTTPKPALLPISTIA